MTGGLLQLVSKGNEDIFLSGDPQVTFFKTVYRRHTNFSKTELDLSFTNKLTFGKEGKCKIEKWGDLLHRLVLVVELPQIDILFSALTIGEVQKLLLLYEIVWVTARPPNTIFDQDAYDEVAILVNQKIIDLNKDLVITDNILIKLGPTGEFDVNTWFTNNPTFVNKDTNPPTPSIASSQYFDDLIINFYTYDQYNVEYRLIDAQMNDTLSKPLPLANSIQIQNMLLNDFIEYAISNDNNPTTHNDDNIRFLYNTDTSNYAISGSTNQIDAITLFSSGIANAYGSIPYKIYDAYNIFNITLSNNNTTITNTSQVQNIKTILLDNERYGLIDNIKLQNNIYDSLLDNSKFIFYRRFPFISTGVYNTALTFTNYSLIPNPPTDLNDNFTSDFTIVPDPNQPSNVVQPFETFVQSFVNTFHTTNRDLFRTSQFTPYFNDLSLWNKTNLLTILPTPTPAPPAQMFFMNYIWVLMTEDIPNAINTYLSTNTFGMTPSTITALFNSLTAVATNIIVIIKPLILSINPADSSNNNYTTLASLDTATKQITGPNGDIDIAAIIRPGLTNVIIGHQTIPEYITSTYNNFINTYNAGSQQTEYNNAKSSLLSIVGLFNTDLSSMPTYATYVSQGYNINNSSGIQINSYNGTSGILYSDAISSIWNYLFKTFVANYNSLYNTTLLGYTYYGTNIGVELTKYLTEIADIFFMFDIVNNFSYDYFRNIGDYIVYLPTGSNGAIGVYLNDRLQILLNQLSTYDANRLLLNMRSILVPRFMFLYEKFNIVVTLLVNTIESDPSTYAHQYHGTPQDIVLIKFNEYVNPGPVVPYLIPRNNALDIIYKLRVIFNQFVITAGIPPLTNPYDPIVDPNKYNLWIELNDTFNKNKAFNNYNDLFGWLYSSTGAQQLFSFSSQIDTLYNSFTSETDVYNFMKDYVTQKSILKDLPALIGAKVANTHNNISAYYILKRQNDTELLAKITGSDGSVPLLDILQRSLNTGQRARFAWDRRLGHYLIDQMWIKIGDQLVDKQYGEWLEIWHSLTQKDSKERGYKIMIGDVPELYTFDNNIKNEYELIIPLQFWFCRNVGASLPLVALNNAPIEVYVKFRELNDICYFDNFTYFRKTPKLKCKMIAEYIYVEDDERNSLVKSKLEYLIDVLQYNGELLVSRNSLNDEHQVEAKMYFTNPCKEFIWFLQNTKFINGSLSFGERKWNVYSYDVGETITPANKIRIKFNSRDREQSKDSDYYNYIQPLEKHYSDPALGIYVYSFSLEPESFHPSGSANMSKIDDTSIQLTLNPIVLNDILNNNAVLRFGIYATSYNVLRVFSGLAGLAFFR